MLAFLRRSGISYYRRESPRITVVEGLTRQARPVGTELT